MKRFEVISLMGLSKDIAAMSWSCVEPVTCPECPHFLPKGCWDRLSAVCNPAGDSVLLVRQGFPLVSHSPINLWLLPGRTDKPDWLMRTGSGQMDGVGP